MLSVDEYFRVWPFGIVPDRSQPIIWAGRPHLLASVRSLLSTFRFRPQSSLDLVWAAFGSGKTHLLYFLEQEARREPGIVPWYAVIPHKVQGFGEIYRTLFNSFPWSFLTNDVIPKAIGQLSNFDIAPILQGLAMGTHEQKTLAMEWLSGGRIDLRVARRILPVPYKLDTADQMQRVIVQLLRLIAGSGNRVLMLLDEFQRVQAHKGDTKDTLNSAILDAFNSTPRGLSVIFSCSAVQAAAAHRSLAPELLDRMKGRPLISLSDFSKEDAFLFVSDLLASHRPALFNGNPFAPFEDAAVCCAVESLESMPQCGLLPRHLVQVLDNALSMAINEGSTNVTTSHIRATIATLANADDGGGM